LPSRVLPGITLTGKEAWDQEEVSEVSLTKHKGTPKDVKNDNKSHSRARMWFSGRVLT
jgi:hypothetical protein